MLNLDCKIVILQPIHPFQTPYDFPVDFASCFVFKNPEFPKFYTSYNLLVQWILYEIKAYIMVVLYEGLW